MQIHVTTRQKSTYVCRLASSRHSDIERKISDEGKFILVPDLHITHRTHMQHTHIRPTHHARMYTQVDLKFHVDTRVCIAP